MQVTQQDKGEDFVGRDAEYRPALCRYPSTGGSSFVTTNYQGIFDPSKNWVDVFAADFDGDGRDDVIARDQASGEWWLSSRQHRSSSFVLNKWDTWNSARQFRRCEILRSQRRWQDQDIIGRDSASGDWSASFS